MTEVREALSSEILSEGLSSKNLTGSCVNVTRLLKVLDRVVPSSEPDQEGPGAGKHNMFVEGMHLMYIISCSGILCN